MAGRKVNLYFLSHNCFGILLAALRMFFRILIQTIFRRVLVSFGGLLVAMPEKSLSDSLLLKRGDCHHHHRHHHLALQREGQGSYYFRNGDVFTGT